MYRRFRGLGYNPQIGSGGTVVDCDSFAGLFQGVCWNPVAPGVPTKVVTDPTTGVQSVVPDLQGGSDAINKANCGMFQTLNSQGVCTINWTPVIIGGGVIMSFFLLTLTVARR